MDAIQAVECHKTLYKSVLQNYKKNIVVTNDTFFYNF